MLLGTGAAIAGAALAGPGPVSAEDDHNEVSKPQPQPLPKPIPGVLAAPPFDFHVFGEPSWGPVHNQLKVTAVS
jgi:hypothetical protein